MGAKDVSGLPVIKKLPGLVYIGDEESVPGHAFRVFKHENGTVVKYPAALMPPEKVRTPDSLRAELKAIEDQYAGPVTLVPGRDPRASKEAPRGGAVAVVPNESRLVDMLGSKEAEARQFAAQREAAVNSGASPAGAQSRLDQLLAERDRLENMIRREHYDSRIPVQPGLSAPGMFAPSEPPIATPANAEEQRRQQLEELKKRAAMMEGYIPGSAR